MTPAPFATVVVLTARRPAALRRCLDSLDAQRHSPSFEVIVVANGDPEVAPTSDTSFPLTIIHVDDQPLGSARNHALSAARGEWLVFLDDDTVAPPHLLAVLAAVAGDDPSVDVVGGPNVGMDDAGPIPTLQDAVLASPVATGPASRRYRPAAEPRPSAGDDLCLCNLAVRRRAAVRFPDGLACAEENGMLHALSQRGAKMLRHPDFWVHHERRDTWRAYLAQIHRYGRGRGQLARRDPSTATWWNLAPLAGVVAVTGRRRRHLAGVYLAAVVAGAAVAAPRLRDTPAVAAAIVATHASYAAGIARGLVEGPDPAPVVPLPLPQRNEITDTAVRVV